MAGEKILVIEDDLYYQTYVGDLLKDAGFRVNTASDGEQGLALAFADIPDLVLTDIELPKMHGFMVLRNLRGDPRTSHLPILMMTGRVEKSLLEKHAHMKIHADGYLIKPFSGEELLVKLEETFSGLRTGPPPGREAEGRPVAGYAPGLPQEAGTEWEAPRLNGQALVVDDSPYVCDIAARFLEEMGLAVITAMDGRSGLDMARNHNPDIVLLDVQLPELNGFAVCDALKRDAATNRIPVILMSAVVDEGVFTRHSLQSHHADGYLTKPFMKRELQELVASRMQPPPVPSAEDAPPAPPPEAPVVIPQPPVLEEPVGAGPPVAAEPDAVAGADAASLAARIERLEGQLEEQGVREGLLEAEMDDLRQERDHLLQELDSLRQTCARLEQERDEATGRESEAQKEAAAAREEWDDTVGRLKRDLEAALAAKEEVEDQAQAILEGRSGVGAVDRLRRQLEEEREKAAKLAARAEAAAAAEGRARDLEKERNELKDAITRLESDVARLDGYSRGQEEENRELVGRVDAVAAEKERLAEQTQTLQEQLREVSRRIESAETERDSSREEAEDARREVERLRIQIEEIAADRDRLMNRNREVEERAAADLERIREEVRRSALEQEERNTRLAEAENRVRELETRLRELSASLEEARAEAERASGLEDRLRRTDSLLQEAEKRSLDLSERLNQVRSEVPGPVSGTEATIMEVLSRRLDHLEEALGQTMKEAQETLNSQRGREEDLEIKVHGLMEAMEAEQKAIREERERWDRREESLRNLMEEAMEEQRRAMGEEVARLYPVQIPPPVRTLEVVSGMRRWGIAALVSLLALLVFLAGYLILSRLVGHRGQSGNNPGQAGIAAPPVPAAGIGSVEEPAAAPPPHDETWRRQTVSSISDDVVVQATLHTRSQVAAAARFLDGDRNAPAGRLIMEPGPVTSALDKGDHYFVSLYIRDRKGGQEATIPENILTRLALRDASGNEVPAAATQRLDEATGQALLGAPGSPTTGLSAGEGVLVRFPAEKLAVEPRRLSLVIYDLGDLPVRVLEWTGEAAGSR